MKNNIFISCSKGKKVEYWILKKKNMLLNKQVIDTNGFPQPLAYCKDNCLLYIGENFPHKILIYKMFPDYRLKKIQETSMFNTSNYISLNHNKKILLCASFHGNGFSIYLLNKSGLIKKNIYFFQNIKGCHFIKMHYKYNLIFVSALKEDKIYIFDINLDFKKKINISLKNIIQTKKNSGPRHISFHPSNNFLYSINEFEGTINVWIINHIKSQLLFLQSISLIVKPYKKTPWSSDIHIHSNGLYLYACDRANNIISLFTINIETGFLFYIHTYQTVLQPRSFYISKNGKLLIVVGEISNSMNIYNINLKNGYLVLKKKKLLGINPLWILIK
ncbi:beta-propeller fold lactonase family protein [Buchnera aphidicola]|uniref:6-phosphogluconolactonase n=1 Tax=Buchnera aphidicola (Cinara strobi) TaxID=1921549 RepID=A0A3B1DLF0_9GAMM|nr:beta-propeller fold lactonase family protein [Buchnera aphidicola]VAX76531.1 6-phosphogluconolactonase [Buchnera aphidicola (Cinara strobi)]